MWSRRELKENAKKHFKANYWWTVLAAVVLAAILGSVPTISQGFNKNDLKKILKGNPIQEITMHSDIEEAKEDIKDAAEDIKDALEDISDEDLDTHIVIGGQEVFGINGSGITDENKEKVNDAIDRMVESFEDNIDRKEVEKMAKETALIALPIAIIAAVIASIISAVGIAVSIFVRNPLEVGGRKFFAVNHSEKAEFKNFGLAFRGNYKNIVKTMFLRGLYTFLWSLLFVIPGIVKAYEYRMIPYLLAEQPDMDSQAAFDRSKEMMLGNKWKAFVLDLSFIGWHILSGLTCGVLGVFYVGPYVFQTEAELYFALKGNDGRSETAETTETTDYVSYVEVE